MRGYNDYVITVKRWLKNYNKFAITIANIKDDIDQKERQMKLDVNAPISKYGGMPSGGKPELNAVESMAERHMHMHDEIEKELQSISNIELTMRKIDRAISGLADNEQQLIKGHYFDGKTWSELGDELYYSEKWARERAYKATKQMAIMIFGPKAAGDETVQLQFIFAC